LAIRKFVRSLTPAQLATLGVVLAIAGVALYIAYQVRDDDYGLAVAAGIGTTLVLAFPLFWLERRFEQRVATEVKETNKSLGKLNRGLDEVRESVGNVSEHVRTMELSPQDRAIQRRQARRESALAPARAAADGTFSSMFEALRQGTWNTPATIEDPVYVTAGAGKWTLGLSPRSDPASIWVNVAPYGERNDAATYEWQDGETFDDMIGSVDEILLAELGEDGAPVLDEEGSLLGDLVEVLLYAQERVIRSGTQSPPAPLRYWPTDHWLITNGTLEHIGETEKTYPLRDTLNGSPPSDAPDRGELVRAWPAGAAMFWRRS
jgi:hypothetical protein